jgi:hypothetical protein
MLLVWLYRRSGAGVARRGGGLRRW